MGFAVRYNWHGLTERDGVGRSAYADCMSVAGMHVLDQDWAFAAANMLLELEQTRQMRTHGYYTRASTRSDLSTEFPCSGSCNFKEVASAMSNGKNRDGEVDVSEEQEEPDEVVRALATAWCALPTMDERGAAGRIVIAGASLTRADLDMNWDIVLEAMQHLGSRPSVYPLRDAVAEFFRKTRPKGKPAVSRILSAVTQFVFCERLFPACVYLRLVLQNPGMEDQKFGQHVLPRGQATSPTQ